MSLTVGIGWMRGRMQADEHRAFLEEVAAARVLPRFHEIVGGRVLRVDEGAVVELADAEARGILDAVAGASASGRSVWSQQLEDFPDVSVPSNDDRRKLALPASPRNRGWDAEDHWDTTYRAQRYLGQVYRGSKYLRGDLSEDDALTTYVDLLDLLRVCRTYALVLRLGE